MFIADASFCVDQFEVAPLIDFISQPADINVNDIAVQIKIHTIDMLGKFGSADDAPLVHGQIFEDGDNIERLMR